MEPQSLSAELSSLRACCAFEGLSFESIDALCDTASSIDSSRGELYRSLMLAVGDNREADCISHVASLIDGIEGRYVDSDREMEMAFDSLFAHTMSSGAELPGMSS